MKLESINDNDNHENVLTDDVRMLIKETKTEISKVK